MWHFRATGNSTPSSRWAISAGRPRTCGCRPRSRSCRCRTIPACIDFIKSQPEYDGRKLDFFFALEMLNVGAHHEILDDPRAPGTADKQKILDQIGWRKDLGITEPSFP